MNAQSAIAVDLRYYAQLREQAGIGAERIETHARTPSELYADLAARHGFTLSPDMLKVAVNSDFTSWQTVLRDGDTVVFIPPVNGG